MSPRALALAAALTCIGLVLAQEAVPSWGGFHTWQYAAVLALLGVIFVGFALEARAGRGGEAGTKLAIAALGAFVVGVDGLASGLLGPDSETVSRAPGTVAPLPEVGAAAFFGNADARAIARGDERIAVRTKSGSFELTPGERRYLGDTVLELRSQLAAYVEAYDARGRRLTITQPTNPAFLSPVLLFPSSVHIAGRALPADEFAAPAMQRQVKVFYFSKAATAAAKAHGMAGKEALLFAVDDDHDRLVPNGIGFAESGTAVNLGGLRLRAVLGSYPAIVLSAVPSPFPLALGLLTFIAGVVSAIYRRTVPLSPMLPWQSKV